MSRRSGILVVVLLLASLRWGVPEQRVAAQSEPPPGYTETLKTGVNQIQDKNLAEYYDHLRKIIRGDLWDPSRLREIALINLGYYNRLLPH